jgi:hypothetical protein
MAWHLAPSLVRLRGEINSKWPSRDKASDGSIGDPSHSARTSDHNPNSRRSVNAIDIDKDGINTSVIIAQAKSHPSTNYIIYRRKIYSRAHGFRSRPYSGANPHNSHIHVSILQTSGAENSTVGWGIGSGVGPPNPPPKTTKIPKYPGLLKAGSKGPNVGTVQKRLNERGYTPKLAVDNDFGPATVRNVKAFQKFAHLVQDGKIGSATWKALWTLKIS